MKTAKDEVRELLNQLPDDSSLNNIQYHTYARQEVHKGVEAIENGDIVPQAEVEKRMSRWLEK